MLNCGIAISEYSSVELNSDEGKYRMGLFSKKTETVSREPETTSKLPLVPFKVVASEVPFYRDEECTDMVEDARLVVLMTLDPEDQIQEYSLVPSTLRYTVGEYVTMNLEKEKLWEDCYYKDPESGEVQKAWRIHVNFVGERIDPETVAEKKEHLEELERRVLEKIDEISKAQAESKGEPIN